LKEAANEIFDTIDGRLLFSTMKGVGGNEKIDNCNSTAPDKIV
jgi:hypothetical protein